MTSEQRRLPIFPWWAIVLLFGAFLAFVSSYSWKPQELIQGWRLIPAFDLGREMNIAVWWSAGLQLAIAFICLEIHSSKTKPSTKPWMLLAILFIVLAMDEVSSIHERLPKIILYGFYMPAILILANYALYLLYFKENYRKSAVLIFTGFCFYGSVFIQELIEHRFEFPLWFKGYRLIMEEGSELLGTLFIFLGVALHRTKITAQSFWMLIPSVTQGQFLKALIYLGFLAHTVACFVIVPQLTDSYGSDNVYGRGIPGAFYPYMVQFFVFCGLCWQARNAVSHSKIRVGLASVLFLFASISSLYNFIPALPLSIRPEVGHLHFIYLAQITALVLLATASQKSTFFRTGYFATIIGIFIASFYAQSVGTQYFLLGLSAFLAGHGYLVQPRAKYSSDKADTVLTQEGAA